MEEGSSFSISDITNKLSGKVTEEDLLNLHGFLSSQISWHYLKKLCETWPEAAPYVIDFAFFTTAAGAAWQRLVGSIPVKKAFAELEPLARHGEQDLGAKSRGGKKPGADPYFLEVIGSVIEELDSKPSPAKIMAKLKEKVREKEGFITRDGTKVCKKQENGKLYLYHEGGPKKKRRREMQFRNVDRYIDYWKDPSYHKHYNIHMGSKKTPQ